MSEYRTAWERYWAHYKDYADANACVGMAHNDHDRIRALEAAIQWAIECDDSSAADDALRTALQRPDDHRQPRQDDRPDGRADG